MERGEVQAGVPACGYAVVRKWLLEALLAAYRERKEVTPRTVLVFLSLLEERARRPRLSRERVRVRVEDLEAGLGLTDQEATKRIRKELRALQRLGLIQGELPQRCPFAEFVLELPVSPSQISIETFRASRDGKRLIPIQRSVIRALAKTCVRGTGAIAATYFSLHVLSLWGGSECRSGGNLRLEEAAAQSGLSRRTLEKHLADFEAEGWVVRTRRLPWVERELGVWVRLELHWRGLEKAENGPEIVVTGPEIDPDRARVRTSKREGGSQEEENQQQAPRAQTEDHPDLPVVVSLPLDSSEISGGKSSPPSPSAQLFDSLVSRGVRPWVAPRLLAGHPPEHIESVLEYFDAYLELGKRVSNPGGWIATLVQKGFSKPDGFQTRAEREAERKRRDLLARERRAAEARRAASESRREAAEVAVVERHLASLSAERREALVAEALSASPFTRSQRPGAKLGSVARTVVRQRVLLRVGSKAVEEELARVEAAEALQGPAPIAVNG